MDLVEYERYRDRVWSALDRCPHVAEVPLFSLALAPSREAWTKAQLEIEVRFMDDSRLRVQEIFSNDGKPSWKRDRKVTKKICYQYMDSSHSLVFRLDSHHLPLELSSPLHLDLPGRRHIHDGDAVLAGQTVSNADFFLAYEWICCRLRQEPLPWEVADAKA